MTPVTLLLTALSLLATAPPADQGWRWPLRPTPTVIRPFAPPALPWGPGHRGVDLAARTGQFVYAANAGQVSYAGHIAGRGVVAITHGDLRTTYLPVRPSVRRGQQVTAGARIGVVHPLPLHCGPRPCLHWGVRHGLTYVDPLTLVQPRVRLLPHWQSHPPQSAHPLPTPAPTQHQQPPGMALRNTTAAAGGAVSGMLITVILALACKHIPARRRPPSGVIDLARERRTRRPSA